jgi:hypothetical protein
MVMNMKEQVAVTSSHSVTDNDSDNDSEEGEDVEEDDMNCDAQEETSWSVDSNNEALPLMAETG